MMILLSLGKVLLLLLICSYMNSLLDMNRLRDYVFASQRRVNTMLLIQQLFHCVFTRHIGYLKTDNIPNI
jgi:hypothetical protein